MTIQHILPLLALAIPVFPSFASAAPRLLVTDQLAVIDVDAPRMGRVLGCVTHPDRTLSNAASAFIATVRQLRDIEPSTADSLQRSTA